MSVEEQEAQAKAEAEATLKANAEAKANAAAPAAPPADEKQKASHTIDLGTWAGRAEAAAIVTGLGAVGYGVGKGIEALVASNADEDDVAGLVSGISGIFTAVLS
jgi:hypothetical protein